MRVHVILMLQSPVGGRVQPPTQFGPDFSFQSDAEKLAKASNLTEGTYLIVAVERPNFEIGVGA